MKNKSLLLLIVLVGMMLTACVDYQGIVDNQNEQETEVKMEMSLGDINADGKLETLVANGSVIRLLSEEKILQEFEPNPSIGYSYLSGTVIDVDNDNVNEIIVYAPSNNSTSTMVFASIYVIDVDDTQQYYLRELPNELSSVYGTCGINCEVNVKDKFIYEIKYKDKEFTIDTSRVYGLSTLNAENSEKLDEEWERIITKGYKGSIVGIVKSELITTDSGQRQLRIYEYVKGADKLHIGYVIYTISFDADGTYEITDVDFLERTDRQP